MSTLGTVILFDIDGTLVSCGGAGRRAMERAFADLGAGRAFASFAYGGMTDPAIARQGLRAAGHDDHDEAIAALLARYLEHLGGELDRADGYRVLAGARELVLALLARPDTAVGLGTGNLARGAELKLARGELLGHFAFGGYGSDHEDRARLLAIGAARGAERRGRAREQCRVVVIGDTPRDIEAARAIGARCVGVATGGYREADLAAADVVVASLEDPRALAAA